MSVVAWMRASRIFHSVAVLLLSQFVALIASAEDRGFLGLQVQGMSPKIAAALQLDVQVGVMVRDISIDGPAAHAGIQRGDLIVKLNDQTIDVTSRQVVWLFFKQLWFEFVPVLHGLQGRFTAQG